MSELQLQNKLDALIGQLSPQKRSQLAREIGRQLAQSQRERISQQRNPDGSAFAPRKVQQLSKRGTIRNRAMFSKLKTARFMRTKTTADSVEIGYSGQNAFIAEVHQYGRFARVLRNASWQVKYDKRELLGFSDEDIEKIKDLVIKYLKAV